MSSTPEPHIPKPLVVIGGIALFSAVGIDFLAVIARHLGRPLLGSIELVQAAVLVVSVIALLSATVMRRHAVVHILVERMSPRAKSITGRIGSLLGALLMLAWLAGSVWIAADLWGGFEQSELLHVPYRWLRCIELAGLVATATVFARQAAERRK